MKHCRRRKNIHRYFLSIHKRNSRRKIHKKRANEERQKTKKAKSGTKGTSAQERKRERRREREHGFYFSLHSRSFEFALFNHLCHCSLPFIRYYILLFSFLFYSFYYFLDVVRHHRFQLIHQNAAPTHESCAQNCRLFVSFVSLKRRHNQTHDADRTEFQ